MEPVRIGLLGCGSIAGAHLRAFRELWESGLKVFDVAATCDIDEGRAAAAAEEIAAFQGSRPVAFTDAEQMLGRVPDLEAVDICTLHSEHHGLATACLEDGKAVIIEKPLGITMRAGRKILDAAVQSRQMLAVAENYRRRPQERAFNWAVRQGRIGRPRTFYWQDASEAMGKWAWRNFRHQAGAGWVLDGGVHFADLFRYHLGTEAQQVLATVRRYEPYRYDNPEERQGAWPVDVEDATFAQVHFDDNVVVQWTWQGSAPGLGFSQKALYGSEGCLHWESGLCLRDGSQTDIDSLVAEFMGAIDAEERERLFPGGVQDPIATELHDFARSVRLGSVPEVDGIEGYKALAICLAVFESAHLNRPVSLAEVEGLEVEGYQQDINRGLGIE